MTLDWDELARRYAAGERVQEIADSQEITRAALKWGLRKHGVVLSRDRVARTRRERCSRGHDLRAEGRVRADGRLICLPCDREYKRRWRAGLTGWVGDDIL